MKRGAKLDHNSNSMDFSLENNRFDVLSKIIVYNIYLEIKPTCFCKI